jgi:hypothetical protein
LSIDIFVENKVLSFRSFLQLGFLQYVVSTTRFATICRFYNLVFYNMSFLQLGFLQYVFLQNIIFSIFYKMSFDNLAFYNLEFYQKRSTVQTSGLKICPKPFSAQNQINKIDFRNFKKSWVYCGQATTLTSIKHTSVCNQVSFLPKVTNIGLQIFVIRNNTVCQDNFFAIILSQLFEEYL